jgi:hypothetical protein
MRHGTGFSLWVLLLSPAVRAEVNRVVILKVDGLPERLIERYAAESADGARQGHSRLPWIQHVFGKNGTWMENFYVRGLSLSAPSWSMLDTGRHLEIRGNAEFDRYTLRGFDYLNFFPFYLGYAMNRHTDMPGVELLDENHVPLLIDRFPFAERYQSLQLLQRGVRWQTLESSLRGKFGRPIKELFDEWQTGFSMTSSVNEQTERELLEKLKDPSVHYLDYFTGEFDHVAHLTNDRVAQFHVIEELDALVGRVWAGIAASPLARTTMLIVVSDHGMNTSEAVFSQGYNLVDWFNSLEGGAHHVLMNRHPMGEFKLRGLDPLVSEVISPSTEATYLAGESAHYPTAVLDLDGNERASISLRNNSLNMIQILLDQLMHKKLEGRVRHAVLEALFQALGRVRAEWSRNVTELSDELRELRKQLEEQQKFVDAQPRQWTKEQRAAGLDQQAKREMNRLETWKAEERGYSAYVAVMTRLLSLQASDFDPGKFKTEDLIPRRSLGERNSMDDLRHYVVGLAPGGMVVSDDGSLDMQLSFRHVDYFAALSAIHVRNNVQKGVADRPVDFIAVTDRGAVRVWRDGHEAIIARREDGVIQYTGDDLFGFPSLVGWHTEREWLNAAHQSSYSNAVIGLTEEMLSDPTASSYLERKRQLRRADMIAFANDHWNFNVRGFNPGGNHGSFLRVSTHSVLLFAGGDDTGIPKDLRVATPYDSLSLVPTILALMGRSEPGLPGPIITELIH